MTRFVTALIVSFGLIIIASMCIGFVIFAPFGFAILIGVGIWWLRYFFFGAVRSSAKAGAMVGEQIAKSVQSKDQDS
jgi:hypothetical protein